MDHPCYQCRHIVEDGKAFCSQCGAPQIRVAIPEFTPPPITGTVGDDLPAYAETPTLSAELDPELRNDIRWPVAWRTCAVAALIAALIMALGLMVPLLAVFGAGLLAVNFYHRRDTRLGVNARSGALLGALCGMIFFGMAVVFETLAVAWFHSGSQVREKMVEALHQAASRSNDPQVQIAFDRLTSPDGIVLMLALGLIMLFLVSIAAGSVAGALTGALLGRRRRP